MKMKNTQIKVKFLISLLFILPLLVIGCKNDNQKVSKAKIDSIENRSFVLDFEHERYELSEIESHFFTTFPHEDPTEGNVIYDRKKWVNKEMIQLINDDGLYLYIKDRKDDTWFDSVRLTSKAYYNLNENNQKILFVFKGKFPSTNGVWPAWWLNGSKQDEWLYSKPGYIVGDSDLDKYSGKGHFYDTPTAVNPTDWPGAGEIDIIETINGDNIIHNTIHTCPQMCDSEWNNDGQIINCAHAKPGDPNSGCSGRSYQVKSVEGTFACLWEQKKLQFFYWTPDEDVRKKGGPLSEKPVPDQWDKNILKNEVRLLETDVECDGALHQEWQCKSCASSNTCVFSNMKMIFNITLCGKWAGHKFDDTDKSLENCQSYIFAEGKDKINNQFIKIEYVSISTY
jgi:hypothetical protein